MKYSQAIVSMLVGMNLLIVSAMPQSGYGGGGGSSSGGASAPSTSTAQLSSQSFVPAPAAPGPAPAAPGPFIAPAPAPSDSSSIYSSASSSAGGGSNNGGGGGGGSGLTTDCKKTEVSPGHFKFICSGVNQDAISLRSEHVLWLTQAGGSPQVVDIEIPNYKIEELIKAGFKSGASPGSTINVLLKKPETSVDAQVDTPTSQQGTPNVKLQYEAVEKKLVHYPNDKPYSPLVGPLLPPLAGGRPQRQVQRISQSQQQYHALQPFASLSSSYSTN